MADANDITEEWRPVVGWEGSYSVSNLGRVRREARAIPSKNGSIARLPQRLLSCPRNGWGYRGAILSANGRRKNLAVHRMVAAAFLGPRPTGADINHIDGDKANNLLVNLEYVSRKGNRDHAVRLGLLRITGDDHWLRRHPERVARGTSAAAAKLTDEIVRVIRALGATGMAHLDIAGRFGVTAPTVWKVIHRRSWTHVS